MDEQEWEAAARGAGGSTSIVVGAIIRRFWCRVVWKRFAKRGFRAMLGDTPHRPMSPPIFLRHLCIFLLIIASPRQSALAAPIPESDDHVM